MSTLRDLHGPNQAYLAELYEAYLADPSSVDAQTRTMLDGLAGSLNGSAPATEAPSQRIDGQNAYRLVAAVQLGQEVRAHGHLRAQLDPLGDPPPGDPALDPAFHGITEADLAALPASVVAGRFGQQSPSAAVAIAQLRKVYCGTIGYDFDHVHSPAERKWLRDAVEWGRFAVEPDAGPARDLLQRLTEVETFERFLHRTFPGQKRFSIEGVDMLVPMMDEIVARTAEAGGKEVVIGMAHRGRLNVMVHILRKPYQEIIARFHDPSHRDAVAATDVADSGYAGDVKYHLGHRSVYHGPEGDDVDMQLTLAPNPSHLEFVNPVVLGMDRASDDDRSHGGAPIQNNRAALAVLVHGDASFPGQGIVAETLNLSRLPGYDTGGSIHIIANNQVGFTTNPSDSRSTLYASDLAKGFEIPIVHVNADDVAACLSVARLAHAYRTAFGKDFLIDLVGYRRWGHNEGDEPLFTQPLRYQRIAEHPTVREIWARHCIELGYVSAAAAGDMIAAMTATLQDIKDGIGHEPKAPLIQPARVILPSTDPMLDTSVPEETLVRLNQELAATPPGFTVNSKLERVLKRRETGLVDDAIDWGHAEALAFASIVAEGTPIRLSGQDAERGTFSHRHAVLNDPATGAQYVPLQGLPSARASFSIYNSPLSENAALGFEYGYSVQAPECLVLWEAQFGDFANGAQVIIDQFIAASRSKWQITPSLVLLLPHGYEGQGSEHSSARLDRWLNLCAEDNLRVVNCTTAAQYFHVLRRQARLLRLDPRPLVVLSPKSLLRHPRATSRLGQFVDGCFQPVLDDAAAATHPEDIRRLILCSGKVYVDLRDSGLYEKAAKQVAIARLEELYPVPTRELSDLLTRYPAIREVLWVQEEPLNMGAWGFLAPTLRALVPADVSVAAISRPAWASPAEGDADRHAVEQERIVREALTVEIPELAGRTGVARGR